MELAMERRYLEQARQGIVMSPQDLLTWGKKQKHTQQQQLPTRAWLQNMRLKFAETAAFASAKKPQTFMAPSFTRWGTVMIDLGMYGDNAKTRWHNKGCGAFILGVECISKKLCVVPVSDKASASWQQAITIMVETEFDGVSVVLSDREAALTSATFRKAMQANFGVDIRHLKTRHKAFLAERYIRFVKERLSTAMRFNKPKDLNWTRHAVTLVKEFNSRVIEGTNVRRNDVNKNNYMHLLSQLMNVADPDVVMNMSTSANHSLRVQKALWRYAVGDLVLLLKGLTAGEKATTFAKPSVWGRFNTSQVYTVSDLVLKRDQTMALVPVYKLSTMGKMLSGLFYERELKAALFPAAS